MKINKKTFISSVMVLVFALTLALNINVGLAQLDTSLGLGAYAGELDLGTKDIRAVIMQVINVLMGFLGLIALIIVLTGGFKWMTAGGSEDGIEEAKKLIIAGIVGLGIVLSSYAIAFFVVDSLVSATQ